MQPITRETIVDRRQPQLRWSAVLGGVALATGLWIMLQVLGTGLGLASVDSDDAGSLRGAGIGTGIWSLIAPLLAMFAGAYLAGRLSGSRERSVGGMHGGVMWGIATALGLWLMVSVVSSLAGNVARLGGAAAKASSEVVGDSVRAGGGIDGDAAMSALGIDANDLLAPINQRLQRDGKPPVTSKQLSATIRGVAQRGLHQGRMDREVLVQELARNTALSRADAEDLARQFEGRYQQAATRVTDTVDRAGERAQELGLQAADKTGKALLLGGLMMLLSLGASIAGGALGVRRKHRDDDAHTTRTMPVVPPPAPTYNTPTTPTV